MKRIQWCFMDDEIISIDEHKLSEIIMNAHAFSWSKILNIGKDVGAHNRIRNSLKSKKSEVALLSNMRKDHKVNTDPVIGPPGRPLCTGNVGFNYRLSHLLCLFIQDLTEGETTECENTEELIAEFTRVNNVGFEDPLILGSLDVKALYPSLDIPHTIEEVCEIFKSSCIKIEGIDYDEVVFYIAISKTQVEIDAMNIQDKCPRRKRKRGPRPNITGNGMKDNKEDRYEPWIMPNSRNFTEREKRELLSIALKIGLETIMLNHIYEFDGVLRKQIRGGTIGLELTGILAKIYMVW